MALLEEVEYYIDRVIPYLIILIFGVIITDIFFKNVAQKYTTPLLVLDWVIVGVFVADLVFKYMRVRNIPRFLRLYWLDILAVFPFFLLLSVFEEFLLISESASLTLRNIFHAGLVLQEQAIGGAGIAQSSELLVEEGSRFGELLDKISVFKRVPRLAKAFDFYEHPKKNKKKNVKKTQMSSISSSSLSKSSALLGRL